MPDLLLELLSEEIPARMQGRAAEDLRRLVTDALVAQGLLYEGAVAQVTPRRLVLHVAGLPAKGADVREEKKGPRVGAPEAAIAGFRKSAGVTSDDEVRIVEDAKKGDYYLATIEKAGRPTPQVLSELLPGIIKSFPWPKSMRWGAASAQAGSLRWVRPLQSVLCTFGSDLETAEIVPLMIDGILSGDATRGHRFMAPAAIRARRWDDYVAKLEAAKVVVDAARRRDIIRADAKNLAFAQGLEVIEDEALLEEVAGLVEWPVCLMGSFEESFLDIPPEVIRATIRANQKCFVLKRGDGTLANKFILVSNIEASDGGTAIVAGNERVVRARLSDAKFFWDTDRKTKLEERLDRLKAIVFHEKLGTQHERIERIAALAREIAPLVGADADDAEKAARLAKADLVTEMVGEFPELQGLMGRYYAAAEDKTPAVAAAIEEHYKPLGPSDRVPTAPVSIAVALADKLDTLVGFWAIDEKPTGSKDPYALRRAALGVIRLVLENGLRWGLNRAIVECYYLHLLRLQTGATHVFFRSSGEAEGYFSVTTLFNDRFPGQHVPDRDAPIFVCVNKDKNRETDSEHTINLTLGLDHYYRTIAKLPAIDVLVDSLLSFFHDRLKVYLRDRGARHDLIDAVLAANTQRRHAEEARHAPSRSTQDGDAAPDAPSAGGSFETPAAQAPQDDAGGGTANASGNDDLLVVVRRVEALSRFLATDDGRNLLAATKRAANILRIEEQKDKRAYDGFPEPSALVEPEEKALAFALARATGTAEEAVRREAFEEAMAALAELRPAVDAFFEKVTVNAPEPKLRENRLRLLAMLRRATQEVADFSKIDG